MIDLNTVSGLKVLFVGDAIMDEYIYVRAVGKAVKENALSVVKGDREVFKGGVWAAAAHAANFCAQVDVWRGDHTMWNTRLVDDSYLRKLIVMHDLRPNDEDSHKYHVGEYDVVVITDFGHGTMTKAMIDRVSTHAKFLAVNAQTNATNFGFNLITKYPRADLVVVDELEARLAAHDRDSAMEDVILKLGFDKIIVTRGIHGAIGFDGVFERQEALTDRVLDSMGAGDAFLSIASIFAAAGASMKDLIRLGNAAGAAKTQIVGHRTSVTKEMVLERLGN